MQLPSSTAKLAARRARARRDNGGAVIFIVATTLGVLAVMGVYALSSTTQDIRSAGNMQRATQARFIGDYGAMAAADYINYENADNIVNTRMLNPVAGSSNANCISTVRSGPSAFGTNRAKSCVRIAASELKIGWGLREPFTSQSFGHKSTSTDQIDGDVYIEITNPTQAPSPPGYDINLRLKFAMVTATSYGVIKPRGGVAGGTVLPGAADTMQVGRGRLIVGPVSQ